MITVTEDTLTLTENPNQTAIPTLTTSNLENHIPTLTNNNPDRQMHPPSVSTTITAPSTIFSLKPSSEEHRLLPKFITSRPRPPDPYHLNVAQVNPLGPLVNHSPAQTIYLFPPLQTVVPFSLKPKKFSRDTKNPRRTLVLKTDITVIL